MFSPSYSTMLASTMLTIGLISSMQVHDGGRLSSASSSFGAAEAQTTCEVKTDPPTVYPSPTGFTDDRLYYHIVVNNAQDKMYYVRQQYIRVRDFPSMNNDGLVSASFGTSSSIVRVSLISDDDSTVYGAGDYQGGQPQGFSINTETNAITRIAGQASLISGHGDGPLNTNEVGPWWGMTFFSPVDKQRIVFVEDRTIRVLELKGNYEVTTVAGVHSNSHSSFSSGFGTSARFVNLRSIASYRGGAKFYMTAQCCSSNHFVSPMHFIGYDWETTLAYQINSGQVGSGPNYQFSVSLNPGDSFLWTSDYTLSGAASHRKFVSSFVGSDCLLYVGAAYRYHGQEGGAIYVVDIEANRLYLSYRGGSGASQRIVGMAPIASSNASQPSIVAYTENPYRFVRVDVSTKNTFCSTDKQCGFSPSASLQKVSQTREISKTPLVTPEPPTPAPPSPAPTPAPQTPSPPTTTTTVSSNGQTTISPLTSTQITASPLSTTTASTTSNVATATSSTPLSISSTTAANLASTTSGSEETELDVNVANAAAVSAPEAPSSNGASPGTIAGAVIGAVVVMGVVVAVLVYVVVIKKKRPIDGGVTATGKDGSEFHQREVMASVVPGAGPPVQESSIFGSETVSPSNPLSDTHHTEV